MGVRNSLYGHGLLRAWRLQGPVISVGNLSAGGSGKTPFVMLLGELLKKMGGEVSGERKREMKALFDGQAALKEHFGIPE